MIIQKVVHAHLTPAETREKLLHLWGYRHHLSGVEKACIRQNGQSVWQLEIGNGMRAELELEYFFGDHPGQILFRSTAGNLNIVGMLEFTEIRADLTEVELAIEASFQSPVARMVDRMTNGLDRFLDRQLRGIRAYLEATTKASPKATPIQKAEKSGLILCP